VVGSLDAGEVKVATAAVPIGTPCTDRLGKCRAEGDTAGMKCFVYRSTQRSDAYVFLRERDAFGLLPAELSARLGALLLVLELDLSAERTLARADPAVVRRNLADQGFHLQLPPADRMPGSTG